MNSSPKYRQYLPSYRPNTPATMPSNRHGLQRLAIGAPGAVIWLGTLEPFLHGVKQLDVRGVYHWSPELGKRGLESAIAYTMTALGMTRWEYRDRIQRGLLKLLTPYYETPEPGCALVLFESCRDLTPHRFQEFRRQGVAIWQASVPKAPVDALNPGPITKYHRKPLRIRGDLPIYPSLLPLETPPDRRRGRCFFRGTKHDRWIVRNGGREERLGRWDAWFLAEPGVDDAVLVTGGYATRVRALVGESVNPSPIMTWMQFNPRSKRLTARCLCLDFDPWSETVLSVRFVEMPLANYIDLDPRLERWLHTVLLHQPCNTHYHEQIESPNPPSID